MFVWISKNCGKWSFSNYRACVPHLTTLTSKLRRHLTCLREIWIIYKKKHCSRNFENPKKFWKSENNWNSRFQNFGKIDLIILPNRSNRSNRKKSLNRLDRFIGQRINSPTLTAHWEPIHLSELAETGSRPIIHISIRVLGWRWQE